MESLPSYTVEHPFSYSQCLYFSQLPVELKSPLLEFCALSLNLTILLLELCILHLHLYLQPIYMVKLAYVQCKYIVEPRHPPVIRCYYLHGYLYITSIHITHLQLMHLLL